MNNEQKERGAKFKGSAGLNKNKTTPKHPDFKGSETIAGVEYWVAVWVNKNDDGTSWLSFEHEAKEALPNLVDSYKKEIGQDPLADFAGSNTGAAQQTPAQAQGQQTEDDDVPF